MTQQLEIKIVPLQNDINIFTAHFCPPIKFSTFHLDPKSDDFQVGYQNHIKVALKWKNELKNGDRLDF